MYVHGFLLMGEKKMSKSLGNVLDPFEVIEKYGSDALRFYCFREVSFGQDGSISTAGFEARYETELANDFGNLASRVLAMVDRYRDGVVPAGAEIDPELADGEGGLGGVEILAAGLLDRTEISRALEVCWSAVRRLNRYVEEQKPWELAKDPERSGDLDRVLYNLVEGLRVVTLLLHAYIPRSSDLLLAALGEESRRDRLVRIPRRRAERSSGSRRCSRSSRRRAMIDSHAHLDVCDPPNAELVADARRVGVTRILTIGLDEQSNLGAVRAAKEHRGRLRRGRSPSELRRGLRRRRDRGDRGARAGGRRQGDRRDRARLLPRPGLGGGPGPRVRGADRDRPPHQPAARHPRPRQQRTGRRAAPSPTATSCSPPRRRASR